MAVTFPNLVTNGTFKEKRVIKTVTVPVDGLVAGSLMGAITATGKLLLSLNGAVDGSQVANCILAEDIANDTAGAVDAELTVYTSGSFIDLGVTFGTGQTLANTMNDLQKVSIEITKGIA